jgi:hypothetical protein
MLLTIAGAASLLLQLTRTIDGDLTAFVIATAFLLLRITQKSLYSVMPDALLAFLSCAAMIVGGYALEGRRRWWIPFWLLTIAAMSVHGRGTALLPVPWVAMCLAGRTQLFRHRALWIATVLVLLPTVPWFLFSHQTTRLSLASALAAATAFPIHAYQCLGPVLFPLMVLGAIAAPYRKEPRWGIVTGVLLGTWIVSSLAIVPWDARYFICAAPASMVLVALGLHMLGRIASDACGWTPLATVVILAAFVGAASVVRTLPFAQKPRVTYEPYVAEILAGPDGNKPVYLIAGDEIHEGAFIASVALQDPAANHIVLRATKALAVTDWSMTYYEPLFRNTADMAAFLNRSWISLVIIQQDSVRPDVRMLHATMLESKWLPVWAPSGTLAYRRTAPLPSGTMTIRVDMRGSLGKYLEATP